MSRDSDVSAACHAYIDGLDRSALGEIAVHEWSLYIAHKVQVYGLIADELNARISAGEVSDEVHKELAYAERLAEVTEHRLTGITKTEYEWIKAELFYWWGLSGNSLMEEKAASYSEPTDRLPIAVVASSSPRMHEYFKLGIWDLDVVSRFVELGVDIELVVSMNSGAEGGDGFDPY